VETLGIFNQRGQYITILNVSWTFSVIRKCSTMPNFLGFYYHC